ncbi:hypothetical protein ACI68E_003431 [Malassezia pachydermatis]|uniref:Uncharacterized protein n=1 Tax=Malassezia pachydermatis TaxID=77020 RepID=A0A0M8MPK5_9BASI|nr:hypothetical protein Malapachy_4251 [Malassezia pachydermatis]KOS14267.1 hypothetical protein Malapachy_4251 [Malassezia pachydermatis]
MSELFDLLNFGTPIHGHGAPDRPRSASPSPRGHVAWAASQPSSSPKELWDLASSMALPAGALPPPLNEKTNMFDTSMHDTTDGVKSPSQIRATRTRRRARASAVPVSYTYNMCLYAPSSSTSHTNTSKETSPEPPAKRRRQHSGIQRTRSDPTASTSSPSHTPTPPHAPLSPTPTRPCSSSTVPTPAKTNKTKKEEDVAAPSSDDSFARILEDDFPIDVAAVEEMAALQGW